MVLTSNISNLDNCITSQVQKPNNHNISKGLSKENVLDFIFQRIGEEAPGPSVYGYLSQQPMSAWRPHMRCIRLNGVRDAVISESLSPRCLRDGRHDKLLIFRITQV